MIRSKDWPKTDKLILRVLLKENEAMRRTVIASASRSVEMDDEIHEHYSSDNNLESDETDYGSSE